MKIVSVNLVLVFIFLLLTSNCRTDSVKTQPLTNLVPPPTATPPVEKKSISEEPPPDPPIKPEQTSPEYTSEQDKQLFETIRRGDAASVKALLEQGANVNANVKTTTFNADEAAYATPLGEAVDGKKTAIARLLLEHDADINKQSVWRKSASSTPSHTILTFPSAVAKQDLPMMRLLVEYHADIKGETGDYPLITKAKTKEVLDYLVSLGFDINTRDDYHGFTALFLAVRDNNLDLVEAILQHKPDLTITTEPTKVNNFKKLTALQWAESVNNKVIIDELKKAGAKR